MTARALRLLPPAALLLRFGCGVGPATTGGASASAGSTDTAGSSGAASASGTIGGGSTTAGGACELPEDTMAGDATVTIKLTNGSTEPRFVLPHFMFCTSRLVQLTSADDPTPLAWGGDQTAPGVRCHGQDLCGEQGCSDGSYPGLILNPGASHTLTWDGTLWESVPVPAGCAEGQTCSNPNALSPSCERRVAFPQGQPYTVTVALAETCPADGPAATCECAMGTCPISVYDLDWKGTPPWKTFDATGTFPDSVEIMIE